MTEYLIGPGGCVNSASGLPSHGAEPPHYTLSGGHRATNDEDGIVAPDGAEDVGPRLTVERRSNGLGTSRDGTKDEHLADAIDAQKQLRQQGVESGTALLYTSVGDSVSRTFGRGDSGQPQLAEIPRESRLGDIPPALQQQLAEILLAAHDPGADDLENRIVSFALVGHGRILSPLGGMREQGAADH